MLKSLFVVMTLFLFIFGNASFADSVNVSCSSSAHKNYPQLSVKWYRDSAEKRAIYREVYNMGARYINQWVQLHHPQARTWGVILDIDETTLDNSWYFYQCSDLAKHESDFDHFVAIPQKSIALPGVVQLTHLVHSLGSYVSLVSNRDGSYSDATGNTLDATVANLKKQNIEFDQVILANYKKAKYPTDKNPRFNAVVHGDYDKNEMVWTNCLPPHQVIAYFGDNIQDFPKLKQPLMYTLSADNEKYNRFGQGYFILPNPIYGSWEVNQYH